MSDDTLKVQCQCDHMDHGTSGCASPANGQTTTAHGRFHTCSACRAAGHLSYAVIVAKPVPESVRAHLNNALTLLRNREVAEIDYAAVERRIVLALTQLQETV